MPVHTRLSWLSWCAAVLSVCSSGGLLAVGGGLWRSRFYDGWAFSEDDSCVFHRLWHGSTTVLGLAPSLPVSLPVSIPCPSRQRCEARGG